MIRKGIVLAAGRGMRMGELTEALPKPMLPLRRKPPLKPKLMKLRKKRKVNPLPRKLRHLLTPLPS